MRITVEIDPHEVREDEARAYEKAVSSFAEEWLKLLADLMAREHATT